MHPSHISLPLLSSAGPDFVFEQTGKAGQRRRLCMAITRSVLQTSSEALRPPPIPAACSSPLSCLFRHEAPLTWSCQRQRHRASNGGTPKLRRAGGGSQLVGGGDPRSRAGLAREKNRPPNQDPADRGRAAGFRFNPWL